MEQGKNAPNLKSGEGLVFVLGDSRTGTTTLHRYLQAMGLRSTHYFFEQSGVTQPAHQDLPGNYKKLRTFIEGSGFVGFSDYPTRTFYRELIRDYPNAKFVLTVRKDTETWQRSMKNFFKKFSIDLDLEKLTVAHETENRKIRELFQSSGVDSLEICIDDSNDENSKRLSAFFGLNPQLQIGWENRTNDWNSEKWSERRRLLNASSSNPLEYVKQVRADCKGLLSEYGWIYLINDGSDYPDYYFGRRQWGQREFDRANQVLQTRVEKLESEGRKYCKIVIPEKSVVYPEFLPRVFEAERMSSSRPASVLKAGGASNYWYLDDHLIDAKSYGEVYFRGDSHTNWLGSWFVYEFIYRRIKQHFGSSIGPLLGLECFSNRTINYAGDLYGLLHEEDRYALNTTWGKPNYPNFLTPSVLYELKPEFQSAERVKPKNTWKRLGERPYFEYENSKSSLPKAVIFRDSTCDFVVEPLAQHFSRSVFVWDKGFVYEDIIRQEKPDIVLHVMAERFLVQYTNNKPFERAG